MQFDEMGNLSGKTLMLLPGTACDYQTNFAAVLDRLGEKYHLICVNYDGFDGSDAVFPDMITVTEKIEQYISIARAFLKDAPIILLDEASASLDVENETAIQEALSRLIRNKTVLVIAHRMRTVSGADKIVVLSEGTIAEEGSPRDLLAQKDSMFHRMAQLQTASAEWSI